MMPSLIELVGECDLDLDDDDDELGVNGKVVVAWSSPVVWFQSRLVTRSGVIVEDGESDFTPSDAKTSGRVAKWKNKFIGEKSEEIFIVEGQSFQFFGFPENNSKLTSRRWDMEKAIVKTMLLPSERRR